MVYSATPTLPRYAAPLNVILLLLVHSAASLANSASSLPHSAVFLPHSSAFHLHSAAPFPASAA
jgi:hypothetical protein